MQKYKKLKASKWMRGGDAATVLRISGICFRFGPDERKSCICEKAKEIDLFSFPYKEICTTLQKQYTCRSWSWFWNWGGCCRCCSSLRSWTRDQWINHQISLHLGFISQNEAVQWESPNNQNLMHFWFSSCYPFFSSSYSFSSTRTWWPVWMTVKRQMFPIFCGKKSSQEKRHGSKQKQQKRGTKVWWRSRAGL